MKRIAGAIVFLGVLVFGRACLWCRLGGGICFREKFDEPVGVW